MAVIARYSCAGLSDPGRRRENNEDRFHADAERGIFFVIDGVGGQAAGEKAADTAYELLRARLERQTGSVAVRIREAITLANNEIYRLAQVNDEWHGMACVLTVGVLEENELTVGQVGDSRLYLIQPGEIRKITHDHSPVGEREDRGEIDEITAMKHPRRNEVYRDVGTQQHTPEDLDFIEITTTPVPPDSVLLFCSDGLSDLVTSRQILSVVEAHAGNPQLSARTLIELANEAGGKDNITVVLTEGPRFAPGVRRRLSSPRTTVPIKPARPNVLLSRWSFLLYGLLLSGAAVMALKPHWLTSEKGTEFGWGAIPEPRTWRVTSEIGPTLANALPGDIVLVPPGNYNEQIRLREGVRLVSERPREAVIRANGVAVSGEGLKSGRIEGFRIQPDDSVYLQTGIQLSGCAVEVTDNEISGTANAGMELTSSSKAVIRANRISARSGAAILVAGEGVAGPRLVANDVSAGGHPGIVVTGNARPVMTGNIIRAEEPVFAPPGLDIRELLKDNTVISPQAAAPKPPAKPNAPSRVR